MELCYVRFEGRCFLECDAVNVCLYVCMYICMYVLMCVYV